MYCFEVANSNQSGIYLDFMQERYYFQIEYVILDYGLYQGYFLWLSLFWMLTFWDIIEVANLSFIIIAEN